MKEGMGKDEKNKRLNDELENQIEFLLAAALRMCGNLHDAGDLVQETMFSVLLYESKGGCIRELRSFLITVLNRKYYGWLRRRYRRPLMSIGEGFDVIDESADLERIGITDEGERLRREIAFLASAYREVIVRHYMYGQGVAAIARDLRIPEGTVKSRLSAGRSQMKKGMDEMEHYDEKSYAPVRLYISNSGGAGLKGEPASLVEDDLVAQNLLYLAYEKPVATEELAKAIGIPMAYVEPIVQRLVEGELMKRIGSRIYTDFIIYTAKDMGSHISAQVAFVEEYLDRILVPFRKFYSRLKSIEWYRSLGEEKRKALEMFCFFSIFDSGSYGAFCSAFKTEQNFTDRPNGGRWIAFGHAYGGQCGEVSEEVRRYSYSGQNNIWLNDCLGVRCIHMSLFYPDGFCGKRFSHTEDGILEENLARLLYILENGIDIRDSCLSENCIRSIPWLVECNILHYEEGRPVLSVPVLNREEVNILDQILVMAQAELAELLKEPLKIFLKDKKHPIPAHLRSVPLQKQYLYSDNAMLMAALRLAMKQGILYNGGYDEGVQPPCPMILVVDK